MKTTYTAREFNTALNAIKFAKKKYPEDGVNIDFWENIFAQ